MCAAAKWRAPGSGDTITGQAIASEAANLGKGEKLRSNARAGRMRAYGRVEAMATGAVVNWDARRAVRRYDRGECSAGVERRRRRARVVPAAHASLNEATPPRSPERSGLPGNRGGIGRMSQEFTGWRKSSRSAANGGCAEVAAGWRKSSHSDANGSCVEVAGWRKSSRSDANGGCVEVGAGQWVVGVRDTQEFERGAVLEFDAGAWRTFIADVKAPADSQQLDIA